MRKTEKRAEGQLDPSCPLQQHTLWLVKSSSDLNVISILTISSYKRELHKVRGACHDCLPTRRTPLSPGTHPTPDPTGRRHIPFRWRGSYDSWEVEGTEDRGQLDTENLLITIPAQNELDCLRGAWVLHPSTRSDRGEMPTKQKYHGMVSGLTGEWGDGRCGCSPLLPRKPPLSSECLLNCVTLWLSSTTSPRVGKSS